MNILNLENKSIPELQHLYNECMIADEFFRSFAGQLFVEKLIATREEYVDSLTTCKMDELIEIQANIRAIDNMGRFMKEFNLDAQAIKEEIENKQHQNGN